MNKYEGYNFTDLLVTVEVLRTSIQYSNDCTNNTTLHEEVDKIEIFLNEIRNGCDWINSAKKVEELEENLPEELRLLLLDYSIKDILNKSLITLIKEKIL
ncbi:MAG: hypothetical protein GY828_03680, partial [Candidatus Gracilibacteria bacterium]|nr:hypothetical protein [Candidatus Gracilibacteria bacterium]